MVYIKGLDFLVCGLVYSSIQGKSGNIEYLFYVNGKKDFPYEIDSVVDSAFEHFKNKST